MSDLKTELTKRLSEWFDREHERMRSDPWAMDGNISFRLTISIRGDDEPRAIEAIISEDTRVVDDPYAGVKFDTGGG